MCVLLRLFLFVSLLIVYKYGQKRGHEAEGFLNGKPANLSRQQRERMIEREREGEREMLAEGSSSRHSATTATATASQQRVAQQAFQLTAGSNLCISLSAADKRNAMRSDAMLT